MFKMYLNFSFILLIFYFSMGMSYYRQSQQNELDLSMNNDIECGILQYPEAESYILDGRPADYMQFPWMIVILRKNKEWDQHCGATLINSKFALSASHCFFILKTGERISLEVLKIVLGVNNWKRNESFRQDQFIKNVVFHENYDMNSMKNDLSIIQLSTPINFEITQIRPICLPEKNDKHYLYQAKSIIAGWGITDSKLKDDLLFVPLPIAHKLICIIMLLLYGDDIYFFYESTYCTYNLFERMGTANGDSGGPLMGIHKRNGKAYLRGVSSFGNKAGFSTFSKVSYFLEWIHKNM